MNTKRLKYIVLLLCLTSLLNAGQITIAVAANLGYVMKDLNRVFSVSHPNTKVVLIMGGSGKLAAQIIHGAPYELFMSANMEYPKKLYENGLALTKPLVYAQGSLVIFSTKKRDFKNAMNIVLDESIQKIAVANPKTAPYGVATIEAMKNAHVYAKVKKKLLYGESISQTVSFSTIAADIGFIAKSSLYSLSMSSYVSGENYMDINPNLYAPISQGMVLLKTAQDNKEVLEYYNFIQSSQAKEIFKKYGYLVP